jgi:serine/threonine protein kinase
MLKIVKSDEFKIHSFLACIDSPDNHTIPVLDEFPRGVEKLIATQEEVVLRQAPPRLFKTTRHPLVRQFLEGVSFMHKHHVAHLDLKPDNIVITATGRLLIIDYGVSVQVSGPESWIKGYRGTKGWAAPEVERDPDREYQPIRADLWSAGRVLEYFADRQDACTSGSIKLLAVPLLCRNPQERPSLSMILDDPILKLKKRKKEEVNPGDVPIITQSPQTPTTRSGLPSEPAGMP